MDEQIDKNFPFKKKNYQLLGIGLAVTVLGYILLAGGGSDDPKIFSEELFNAQRMYVAPIIIAAGLGIIGWGIMKKSD